MGWFSKKDKASPAGSGTRSSLLPRDAVELLAEYGRWRYDASDYRARPGLRCGVEDPEFYYSFSRPFERSPQQFLAELRSVAADRDDWTTVGASRLLQEELHPDEQDPNYIELADATLVFFFNRGDHEFSRLTGYERRHWADREDAIVARAHERHA